MSSYQVPVMPGKTPVQITGASPTGGTIIYNMDPVNAVWIGRATVTPGSGIKVGPLGTTTWQGSNGNPYACVDTGVNASVLLNISSDITDLQNPVDVASATAAKLLAQGVPNVSTYTPILLNGNATIALAQNQSVTLDVHAFQSFAITYPTGVSAQQGMQLDVRDPVNVAPLFLYSVTTPVDGIGNTANISWFNVKSSTVKITNYGLDTITIGAIGSNNQLPTDYSSNDYLDPQLCTTGNQNMIAGQTYTLGYLNAGGPAYVEFVTNGSIIKGHYQIVSNTGILDIADTSEMTNGPTGNQRIYKNLILPRGLCRLQFSCSTSGTAAAFARIIYQGH